MARPDSSPPQVGLEAWATNVSALDFIILREAGPSINTLGIAKSVLVTTMVSLVAVIPKKLVTWRRKL